MISPSAHSRYDRCPRDWWYHYVDKRRPPPDASIALGTATHDVVERYLLGDRAAVDSATPEVRDRLRSTAVGYLDRLRALDGFVEAAIDAELPDAPDRLGGRCDWHHPHGAVISNGEPTLAYPVPKSGTPLTPVIVDHKTTKSPAYWGTPETLARDMQLRAYAAALFPDYPGPVVVGHLYLPPRPTEPDLVLGVTTREGRDEALAKLAAASREIAEIRKITDPDAVPAKPGAACTAYRGCYHAAVCSACPAWAKPRIALEIPKPEAPAVSTPAQKAALDRLLARVGMAPTPLPEPPPPTTTPAQPPADDAVADCPNRPTPNPTPEPNPTPNPAPEPNPAPKRGRKRKSADEAPVEAPPGPPAVVHVPIVLAHGATAVGAVPVPAETWFEKEFAAAGAGGSWLTQPYNEGVRTAAALIAAAVRSGCALPHLLYFGPGHPVAPLVLASFAGRATVITGGGA